MPGIDRGVGHVDALAQRLIRDVDPRDAGRLGLAHGAAAVADDERAAVVGEHAVVGGQPVARELAEQSEVTRIANRDVPARAIGDVGFGAVEQRGVGREHAMAVELALLAGGDRAHHLAGAAAEIDVDDAAARAGLLEHDEAPRNVRALRDAVREEAELDRARRLGLAVEIEHAEVEDHLPRVHVPFRATAEQHADTGAAGGLAR